MTVSIGPWRITGQREIDSYVGSRVELAVLLVNRLTATSMHGRSVAPPRSSDERLAAITAQMGIVSRSPGMLTAADADRLARIAADLRPAFGTGERILEAATQLNELLIRHRAVPNLHGNPNRPLVLAFHQADSSLVDAWVADMGTALAMIIGVGQATRLCTCQADKCSLVFFDTTRNASRRFWATTPPHPRRALPQPRTNDQ